MPTWKKVVVSGSAASLNSLNVATNVVAQSFTGSLFGTASYSTQALSSSYAVTASYALNAGGAASSAFPFTGSAAITGSLILTGSLLVTQSYISTIDYIDYTLTANPAYSEGRTHWTDDTKTLNVDTDANNFSIELGHQSVTRVNNPNSFTLTKGLLVYISGSQGNRPTVVTASWTGDPDSAATLGFVAQDINSGHNGYIVTSGILRGINTNAYAPGTQLYLSSSGQYTSAIPQSPLHEVRLGKTVTQATDGILYVDIMNGYELGELHDVLITSQQNGDLITWNSGSRVFQNTKILSGSYGVSGSLNVSQGITGSLFGTASYSTQALSSSYSVTSSHALNASVRTAGTSLYSADPATFGFSEVYGIFLGYQAGALAGAADSSNFIGYQAGFNSLSAGSNFIGYQAGYYSLGGGASNFIGYQAGYESIAYNSNFIGSAAGYGASEAHNSNFIGNAAGGYNSFSEYSNFIGWNVGNSNNLGNNNILIGTNIGLPENSTNRINIGGLLYGTNAYFDTGSPVFSGSINGQIGINQPNPQYSFDVSGSGNYTNGLTVTGSVRATSFTGSLFGTASYSTQALSSSYAVTASYALNAGGAASPAFPFTGSAQITGSLNITGSLSISSSLFQYADNTDVDIGTEVVLSIATGSYRSAFFDYVISSGSNARAGTVMSVWGSSSIDFTETSTNDIGTTTDVTLSTILSGSFVQLRATTLSNNWIVKSLVRML